MKNKDTLFQYCQKLVIFSKDHSRVLLCKRIGEVDYDGVYSFPAGKMEHKDASTLEGLKREKDEELGTDFKVGVFTKFTTQEFYLKKDGTPMILPHYYTLYINGDISLNEEYDDYRWIELDQLDECKNRVPTIDSVVERLLQLRNKLNIKEKDLVII